MNKLNIKRALVSVYDKTNIELLVPYFERYNIEVFSTGGTHKFLKESSSKLKLYEISDLTNFPEILDGRVKTLHPKVHAGILADKSKKKHTLQLEKLNIKSFDLVVVNLYPFENIVNKKTNSFETCIEFIDIGGPSMIRAAAKNFKNVAVISHKDQINEFVSTCYKNNNFIDLYTRKILASEAFKISSFYEGTISKWFSKEENKTFQNLFLLPLRKVKDLRYGENPHQKAAAYQLSDNLLNQVSGKEISYNNINDMDIAIELALEFNSQSCVIVKHGNPCGVSVSEKQKNAYKEALKCNPVSAFGGIVAFNNKLELSTAKLIKNIFTEIVIAPKITKEAKSCLSKRKNLILIEHKSKKKQDSLHFKSTRNLLLIQEYNNKSVSRKDLKFVTKKKPSLKTIEDLLFAFTVCKYVNSNAVVVANNKSVTGIGVGQTNRIDATKHAINQSLENFKNRKDIVLASDGFFPFSDIIEICKNNGIKAVIQPGGSINDKEIISEADKSEIAIIFTGTRHFKH